jgi:hypothetical protein
MIAEEVNWEGLEVHTREAIWVCVKSQMVQIPSTVGGIEYHLEFAARELRIAGTPMTRKLCLRTSDYFVATSQDYLALVIQGQMIETGPWDRFIAVYERD